jgi:hypothetical protein
MQIQFLIIHFHVYIMFRFWNWNCIDSETISLLSDRGGLVGWATWGWLVGWATWGWLVGWATWGWLVGWVDQLELDGIFLNGLKLLNLSSSSLLRFPSRVLRPLIAIRRLYKSHIHNIIIIVHCESYINIVHIHWDCVSFPIMVAAYATSYSA